VCDQDELVCRDDSTDPTGPFYFFYDIVFIKLGLHLPLDLFEKESLTDLNKTIADLNKIIEVLNNDIVNFYGVGFEVALEHTNIVHLSIDLS